MSTFSASSVGALHVLLWSPRQKVFHRDTVSELLQESWELYLTEKDYESDWIVLGFARTPEGVASLQRQLRQMLDTPIPDQPPSWFVDE